jgi:pimeloyl-ACP methyl ester carboxylesterase
MTESTTQPALELVPISSTKLGETGDPIFIMHGWGQTQDSMRVLGDLLSKWYQVYLIDLPGFGKTPKPQADWDTIEYAKRIAAYVDELNLGSVHLIGHSFGGRVSIRLASRFPEQALSVILINSGGLQTVQSAGKKWRSMRVRWLGKACKAADATLGTNLNKDWFVPNFGSRDYLAAGSMRTILIKAVNEDVSEDAQKIKAPTFLLWGDRDQETPVEFAYRFHKLIQNSRLVVMPGKDHFPFVDEGAHLCASYILKFLKDLCSAGLQPAAPITDRIAPAKPAGEVPPAAAGGDAGA